MSMAAVKGVIRRRILVNYRVDPCTIQAVLPRRFRPRLHKERAICGICLIRLEHVRPRGLPAFVGVASENAAHRIAVEWTDDDGTVREGVFVPRRDTDSRLNRFAGGRMFPGLHNPATFDIRETADSIDLTMVSNDGKVAVRVKGRVADQLGPTSGFESLEDASRFFAAGCFGYSPSADPHRLEGVELRTAGWNLAPLDVESAISTFFANPMRFPPESMSFDSALIMRNLEHEWVRTGDMHA
jgi:hypothetical protein